MDEYDKLEELLEGDYFVVVVLPLSRITTKTIDNIYSVFSIEFGMEILLDSSNSGKCLLMLRHKYSGHRVEILTSNEHAIKRANEQYEYQDESIGTIVRANCVALGGRSVSQRIFHLDDLVASLNDFSDWKFELKNFGTFEVVIQLDSIEDGDIEETINKLQCLLDCLAISQQVGFHIQHYSKSAIKRFNANISIGPEERSLEKVNLEEITNIEKIISISTEASTAARGLNQSFIENCLPSRLSMLWAASEHVFGSKAEKLLTDKEIGALISAANEIESLKEDKSRLDKFKETIRDPNRLPLENRNIRMAKAISQVMNLSEEDTYSKVRDASRLRGKHVHDISMNWKDIEISEKFLQKALLCYLESVGNW